MAIVKKTLGNGVVVGFDTDKNSYCNLPTDYEEPTEEHIEPTEDWPADELLAYAKKNGIDTGMATTSKGVMDKIRAAKAV